MLDLKFIEQNAEKVKSSLTARQEDHSIIDQLIEKNNDRKSKVSLIDEKRHQLKELSKKIGMAKKNKENADDLVEKVHSIKNDIEKMDENLDEINTFIHQELLKIPNIIASDVPIGKSEEDNKEIKRVGDIPEFSFEPKDHVELGENLEMLDFQTASKLTGSRFAVYKKGLARLERALINYMIDFHLDRGYEEIIPPYIVNDKTLEGTGQLPKFKDDVFKIEGRDWYLIPTAEVPLTNLKRESVFSHTELPLNYVGFTPCFRSEAGSYGKDTRGLIRLHQFNKVEMVNIVDPDKSNEALDAMADSAMTILENLKLPYRALILCSGDIGFSATKTIDLEVWVPAQNKYREISSVSNCLDFQSRRASIRFKKGNDKPQFAHTLNGSGLAVGRTVVAIMENYQQEDGSILVPEVLWPYMGGQKTIQK